MAVATKLVYPTSHHLDNLFCAKNGAMLAGKILEVAGFGDFCILEGIKRYFSACPKAIPRCVYSLHMDCFL